MRSSTSEAYNYRKNIFKFRDCILILNVKIKWQGKQEPLGFT
eukprot:UN18348